MEQAEPAENGGPQVAASREAMEQSVQHGAEEVRGHPPDFSGNLEHKAEHNNCRMRGVFPD
jgi:hypothetical protein